MLDSKTPLSIVTPCYNEEDVIPFLAETLAEFAANEGAGFELTYIFVDDGSGDDTWPLLNQYFPASEHCVLLRHASNQGIAGAVLTGFQAVTTPFVAVIDSDCTFHPRQLPEMFKLMTEGVDVVASSPLGSAGAMENVPAWRQSMSYGAAFLYRLVMRQKLTSYTACFRVFRTEAIAGLRLNDYGFCGITEILARLDMQGARFVEYPAILGTREYGQSKINTLRTVRDHLGMIGKIILAKGIGRQLQDRPLPELARGD